MSVVFKADVGATDSNSYLTVSEAQDYFDARTAVAEWDSAASQEALLMMATRVLNAMLSGHKALIRNPQTGAFYLTSPAWTGAIATTTQALAWPRTGMYNRNGVAIASNVVPIELKEATAELAGQLAKADRTADIDAMVQGITSVKAGSVAVTFKDMIDAKVLPDAVWNLMPDSWYTDEIWEPALAASFEVL
jgi:hypothetical protein